MCLSVWETRLPLFVRVPVPFESDRANLLANPKWTKNAKSNNMRIVWADFVLKINRKDGKVGYFDMLRTRI